MAVNLIAVVIFVFTPVWDPFETEKAPDDGRAQIRVEGSIFPSSLNLTRREATRGKDCKGREYHSARAFGSLVKSGMALERAAALAGLLQDDEN